LKKYLRHAVVAVCLGLGMASQAGASSNWGPLLANNILGGAAAGALVGLSAGTMAYGFDNNYHPQYLLSGTVYGLLGGALLGGGMAAFEIANRKPDTGFTVAEYLSGGAGIGLLLGGVVATIPYMRDGDPEDFTIGLGLGGVIGATAGLAIAVVDLQSRSEEGDRSLSGRIGIMDVAAVLPSVVPGQADLPVWNCKLVKVTF
jgi:hypothetical protein